LGSGRGPRTVIRGTAARSKLSGNRANTTWRCSSKALHCSVRRIEARPQGHRVSNGFDGGRTEGRVFRIHFSHIAPAGYSTLFQTLSAREAGGGRCTDIRVGTAGAAGSKI